MGKGPGTIYKDCIAKAIQRDKQLAKNESSNDIQRAVNLDLCCCTLFEQDVKLAFFEQNYSDKTTEKAILQWANLDLVGRIPYKGYKLIAFYHTVTSIPDEKGAKA